MPEHKPKRQVSILGLLFASVSAILGSGWLFAAYYATSFAGPAAIVAWIIGGLLIMIIAFVFAELAAMIPISGSSVRIPHYTHGTIVSFIFSWLTWLAWVSLVPTEVQAVIQYLSYYFPALVYPNNALTHLGYIVATSLMLIITIVNIYSLRWLIRCNLMLTFLKIIIPLVICTIIINKTGIHIYDFKHLGNHKSFAPFGMHGIFAAIASGGILFTFNGFKQACEMAGEAKNPQKSLPIAVVGSVCICLLIYIILQVCFTSAITPQNIAAFGWHNLSLSHPESPFASILSQWNLQNYMPLLYIGAIIGPLAAAFLNMLSASRSLYGKSKNGYLPKFIQQLNSSGHPTYAIIICFFCGMLLFAPLPGWHQMITFLTSIMALTYAMAPICVISLRKQVPDLARPFTLPFINIWATLAFFICNLLIYWSGWDVISKLSIALIIGFAILFICRYNQQPQQRQAFNFKSSLWIWPYFLGITIISYAGYYGHGHKLLPEGIDIILIALLSIFILWLAQKLTLPATETYKWIEELTSSPPVKKTVLKK